MKRIIMICLAVVLCGSLAFFACDTSTTENTPEKITITFKYENYATGNAITIPSAPLSVEIDKGTSLGSKLPTSSNVGDYTLVSWKNAGGAAVTASTVFDASVTITGVVYKTNFAGNLLGDDGKELKDPVTGEPVTPPGTGKRLAGTWVWFNSDDSKENETVSLELPKPPYKTAKTTHSFPQSNWGGASTISGVEDEEDDTILRPVTKTVAGPDGNQITVFNFTGTVKVSEDNRGANTGSRFPLVGWEAIPDEDTLTALQSAYAYSFCIRVNSASVKANPTANPVNRWVFKTAVCADGFANEQGHEFKHYFGNYQPTAADNFGPNATTSMTEDLAIGEWYRITVYLNPEDDRFNLDQDNYIHQWNKEFEADFNPATVTKLQWQIALQDQSGVPARGGEPYDITRGEFTYDFDFFGLELYLPE